MNVPELDSRIACGTSLMSYSPPKPTVEPSMRVCVNFSEMTIWPLYVGFFALPPEIGIDLTVLPSRTTVMVWVFMSTVETWERPTVKDTVLDCTPVMPWPPLTPSRSIFSVTLDPAFQYCSGRKSRRWEPNQ